MNEKDFPSFRERPLVRSGDTIYYGSMKSTHVVKIDIKTKKQEGDLEIADKVSIQMLATNASLSLKDRIAKTAERTGLYTALDLADAWLTRIEPAKEAKPAEATEEKAEEAATEE